MTSARGHHGHTALTAPPATSDICASDLGVSKLCIGRMIVRHLEIPYIGGCTYDRRVARCMRKHTSKKRKIYENLQSPSRYNESPQCDACRSLNVTYGDLAPGSYNATMAKLERRLVHGLHSIS